MSSTLSDISAILGWLYILAWGVSFYPQAILNYRRKAVTGLSLDYMFLNVLGFLCYAVYTVAFLSSKHIQHEYQERNPTGSGAMVQLNDAVFACHAVVLSSLTLSQAYFFGYEKERSQRLSRAATAFLLSCVITIILLLMLAQAGYVQWIDVVYALSYVKMMVSILKYIPQLLLIRATRSTKGFSMINIGLDFVGGILSLLQLFIDCIVVNDFTAITGNLVKTVLGSLSLFFDCCFGVQHFILYGPRKHKHDQAEHERLLNSAPTA